MAGKPPRQSYRKGINESQHNELTLEKRKAKLLVSGVGFVSEMGKRDYNEDETILRPKFTIEQKTDKMAVSGALSFFGVFDGHGGRKAAEYTRDHLLDNLKFSLWQGMQVEDSFKFAYLRTEYDFFETSPVEETSGATAVTVLIENDTKRFWCANAGDSRAIMCRNGEAVALSEDHRVSNAAEVERIQKLGGFIKNKRAMGRLECFRTIGDADVDSKVITAEPEVKSGVIEDTDEFIILACDGLYDVLTNDEIVQFVQELRTQGLTAKEISQRLVDHAINVRYSKDNVTMILILLNGSGPSAGSATSRSKAGVTSTSAGEFKSPNSMADDGS
eukprot:TRINITY_DN1141_c0_g1_i1.p1 TRINITY_DN1141_c0_g1~~TRINITY_DN1141_c0_g1_i1.p1  ORF type:complete len:332 (-),score=72.23 TRINITY_DN1141_c0_g1_i1:130-1125(-)